MNKLAIFAITLLLICGAALWLLAPNAFNDFIKQQIETIGSKTTGQSVKINNVDFKLTQGMAAINGLSISNPKGYQQPHAFTLGNIALDVDIASLTKEPIVIENFTINDAKAFVELTQSGHANIKDILDNITKNIPKSTQQKQTQEEPKVRVDKLVLAGIGLTIDLTQLGAKSYQEELPKIDLGNVGGKTGMPVSQLGKEIGKKIINAIWQQAKVIQQKKLRAEIEKKAKAKAKELKQKAKEKAKKLESEYKDKAKEKLNGLFKKLGN